MNSEVTLKDFKGISQWINSLKSENKINNVVLCTIDC